MANFYSNLLVRKKIAGSKVNFAQRLTLGWGYKRSGKRAIYFSKLFKKGFILFEDAPVRSLKPGYSGAVYGITIDKKGAMFDASGASDLIDKLNNASYSDDTITETLSLFRKTQSSKYNWSLPQNTADYPQGVLLVDQSKGDASLKYSGIDNQSFKQLFNDALQENPDVPLYIKTHPDKLHRNKKSCFTEEQLSHPRVRILPPELTPSDCFNFCSKVYVGSSLMGMEALIHGKQVITYGWNFYAGWGLTDDRNTSVSPPRSRTHTIEELFHAAYIDYAEYYHPDTLEPCALPAILKHIAIQKETWANLRGSFTTFKANSWKRYLFEKYVTGPETQLTHSEISDEIPINSTVLLWGMQPAPPLPDRTKVVRVEDGFIRSNGLGAKLTFPLSWVFDDVGIYFNSRSPSKLENALNLNTYSKEQLAEASQLVDFLKTNKLTKYNLGLCEVVLPSQSEGKKVILVPGQVDSDASIKYGSPKLKNNKELLDEVRRQTPDAFVCYKPHPDLLSGARKDKPLWKGIDEQVDLIIKEGDIISWIEAVDEVHTLTSTVGFEALMRNKPVFTYGLPFYAGWGLTKDWLKCERRSATRTIEELVYATLIEYPTYLNPKTGEFTTALNAAKLLADPNFKFDARPRYIKCVGALKSFFNKATRLFK
jgi:capsular polysaccharide export protein